MYASGVRGFVRRGMTAKTGREQTAEPPRSSPVLVPAVLASPPRPPPTPKGEGPPPLTSAGPAIERPTREAEVDDGIEELEASNLLSASDPPPEEVVDPNDVMDAPASERLSAAKASGTLVGIGHPPTNVETKESDPPARIPIIDPSVFRADEIASASVDGTRRSAKPKIAPVAMPRKTEEIALVPEKRGSSKAMAVVAAVLVLGAGLALLGISAHDEPQKPRATTTTEVSPAAPAPTTPPPSVEPIVEPAPTTPPPTRTPTVTAAPTATTKVNAPVATPRATSTAAAEKTPPPRAAAPPPGLEFLKTDL